MGGLSFQHILLLAVVALLLFGGRGKISEIMGDFAKGIKSFKKGLNDDDETPAPVARTLESRSGASADVAEKQKVG